MPVSRKNHITSKIMTGTEVALIFGCTCINYINKSHQTNFNYTYQLNANIISRLKTCFSHDRSSVGNE